MASSRSSSADSSKSYDSVESYKTDQFCLTPAQKQDCLEALHCSTTIKAGKTSTRFITWTSHWVKKRKVSLAVYKLLKIKRWHIIDENFIFDPLKKFKKFKKLIPKLTLWRDFEGAEEAEEYYYSVDGILGRVLEKEAFDSLQLLDKMLAPLDNVLDEEIETYVERQFRILKANYVETVAFPRKAYSHFLTSLASAVVRGITHEKVQKSFFQRVFEDFINLLAGVQSDSDTMTFCNRDVNGAVLDRITIPVKLDDQQEVSLQISSKPDLFMYCISSAGTMKQSILGVIEVKGKVSDVDVLHSSDEEEAKDSPGSPDATLSKKKKKRAFVRKEECTNDKHKLHSVQEVEEDEDEEDIVEELNLEQMIEEPPEWLARIANLPPYAVKHLRQFLPQLLGEMLCAFRSEAIHPFRTQSGMHFGIGVVGFDIYFTTMFDPSHKCREETINDNSSHLNVFITKPFNMLIREDRRKIIKILAASFHLAELGV